MNTKRNFLIGIAGVSSAAAIPIKWTKPIINTIVLPSHAQMSINSAIRLVGEGNLVGYGTSIQFIDATVNQAGSRVNFLVRVSADVTQTFDDFGEYPNIGQADLYGDSDDRLTQGTGNCDPSKIVATVRNGINFLEISFTLVKGKTYTDLYLGFYPIPCAPKFLGPLNFKLNITG